MLRNSQLPSSLTLVLSTLAVSASLWAGGAQGDVYKYTDEEGNVQYTDKPRVLPAELMRLQSKRTDQAAAQARSAAELKRSQELLAGDQKTAAAKNDQKAAAEMTEKDKAERCIKARERYDSYMNSQRLYKTGANGEREYLDAAQLTESRNTARITMEELCK